MTKSRFSGTAPRNRSITPSDAPRHISFIEMTLPCGRAPFIFHALPARDIRDTRAPRSDTSRDQAPTACLRRRNRKEARFSTRDRGWNRKPPARADHPSCKNRPRRGYPEDQGEFVSIPWRWLRVARRVWRLYGERVASSCRQEVYREARNPSSDLDVRRRVCGSLGTIRERHALRCRPLHGTPSSMARVPTSNEVG